MKLRDLDQSTKTIADLLVKYADDNISEDFLMDQLKKGIKVELEHTTDEKVAEEIALDHLDEFPDYYDRLEQAESD